MILIKEAKAQCLIDSFFLPPVAANLDDIVGSVYSESIDFLEIFEDEISQAIIKIASNIVSKENDISNRVIKLVLPHIMSIVK
jgi:flagellar biosynthesis/type III secretory pathway protein FliH